jgi:hypothetical protein
LQSNYPSLIKKFKSIYKSNKWGQAVKEYYDSKYKIFNHLAKKYKIPQRVPNTLFNNFLWENDLVIVLLEHIDYYLKIEGKPSPFGYAAYSISKLKEPLSNMKGKLRDLKGVGSKTEAIILEILETGTSKYYEKLLYN